MNKKRFVFLISCICLIAIIADALYVFMTEKRIKMGVFFFACLIINFIVNQVTWGDVDGISKESQDELGKHISYLSYKTGYFVLIIVMFIALVIEEGNSIRNLDNIQNSSLYLALCASFVVVPITEFFVSKKFK